MNSLETFIDQENIDMKNFLDSMDDKTKSTIEQDMQTLQKDGIIKKDDKFIGEMSSIDMIVGEMELAEKIPQIAYNIDKELKTVIDNDMSSDKFIYAYTDSGKSKNNRIWSKNILEQIMQQVNEKKPPAFLGHQKPEDEGYKFRTPQVTWLGGVIEELQDDNVRLWLKGYVLPGSYELKSWIKAESVNSISIYGMIISINTPDGEKVLSIDLKSIDIAEKLKEGLNAKIVALKGEMKTNQESKKEVAVLDKNKIIESLTLEELKTLNPTLVGEMEASFVRNSEELKKQEDLSVENTKLAGEMEALNIKVNELGGFEMLEKHIKFAGEMTAVLDAKVEADANVLDVIVEETKSLKDTFEQIKDEASIDAESELSKDQVVEVVKNNFVSARLSANQSIIEDINSKFNDLTIDIKNDTIKEMIKEKFSFLELKAEDIKGGKVFKEETLAKLEADMPAVKEKVVALANKLMGAGKEAGEMNAIISGAVAAGEMNASDSQTDINKMTPEEMAKYLGYGK